MSYELKNLYQITQNLKFMEITTRRMLDHAEIVNTATGQGGELLHEMDCLLADVQHIGFIAETLRNALTKVDLEETQEIPALVIDESDCGS